MSCRGSESHTNNAAANCGIAVCFTHEFTPTCSHVIEENVSTQYFGCLSWCLPLLRPHSILRTHCVSASRMCVQLMYAGCAVRILTISNNDQLANNFRRKQKSCQFQTPPKCNSALSTSSAAAPKLRASTLILRCVTPPEALQTQLHPATPPTSGCLHVHRFHLVGKIRFELIQFKFAKSKSPRPKHQ